MRAAAVLTLSLLAGAAGAQPAAESSRYEETVKETLGLLDGIAATLATVQDQATAEAARPELRKAAGAWGALLKKAGELPPPERAEKDRLAKEYRARLTAATRKLLAEVTRVGSVPAGREALREISSVLEKPAP